MMIAKVLSLLFIINSLPLFGMAAFPQLGRWPLDRHRVFRDGNRLLGKNKTVVGFGLGVLAGVIGGGILGFPLWAGGVAGLLGMLGDSLSSFIKRRIGTAEGVDRPVLDQLFESALPLLFWYCRGDLSWPETVGVFFLFVASTWAVSGVRRTLFSPPKDAVAFCVRSTKPFHQWRSCHTALSPFARLLNFESIVYHDWVMGGIFKGLGLYDRGLANAKQVGIKSLSIAFPRLPKAFGAYRILFISDLHIDGIDDLVDRLIALVSGIEVDLCLLGGDYRMEMFGSFIAANEKLQKLVAHIRAPDGVFGILGNHDCLQIAPDLEDAGITMLINDAVAIDRGADVLYIAGVDDPHYYKTHSLEKAYAEIPPGGFSILLAHSPEILHDIDGHPVDLCLCGHTHGGQIRLPGIGAVFTHAKINRQFISGLWQYRGIIGYTTSGVGSSGIPVRYNCPPEVVLLTLTTAER